MNIFDSSKIQSALTTHTFGRNLVLLPRTGSTNDVAKGLVPQNAPDGTVVLADEQTAGRGRMERQWLAPPGTCILCSILFRPDLALAQAQWLTMLCAMAAADAVDQVAGLQVSLKWPNDLIIKTAKWTKLSGILTETGVTGERLSYAVVGIGMNVNVAPRDLPSLAPDATSILAETGREVDRTTLLAALLAGVETRYARLQAGTSPHIEWAARLATLGQSVEATTSGGSLVGIAESVDDNGALLLRTPDGELHRLMAGDVTLARW
ncbi:MAG: biotin--[acetyl-CoA-carboxylase] ligase [Chloroflexi bacterium]|nr:biotin--[acetyl-CoA-carboxylase] ligase [Chloroflexota bacterium]